MIRNVLFREIATFCMARKCQFLWINVSNQSHVRQPLTRNFCVTGATRKRGGTRKAPESGVSNYQQEVDAIMFQLHKSIKPLEPLNTNFECLNLEEDGKKVLLVRTLRGDFKFNPNHDDSTLVFQSYISGYHNYSFDTESKLWLSIKSDRHDLRGMVTRDFLRHCTGCIQFP